MLSLKTFGSAVSKIARTELSRRSFALSRVNGANFDDDLEKQHSIVETDDGEQTSTREKFSEKSISSPIIEICIF